MVKEARSTPPCGDYYGKLAENRGASSGSAWQDEHTGDLKRFRNMLCIMYGGNPGVFESVTRASAWRIAPRRVARTSSTSRTAPGTDPGAAYPRGHLVARGLQPATRPARP